MEALRALLAAGADISNTDINGGSPVINTIYMTFFFSLFFLLFCSRSICELIIILIDVLQNEKGINHISHVRY